MKNPRAFPSDADPTQPGMNLLDYFSGQTLGGLIVAENTGLDEENDALVAEANAAFAYMQAEAMLRERERRSQ